MEQTQPGFFIGQLIHHRMFDYRGVIFGVDATFQGTEDWYTQVAKSKPPKDRPWYHVLVNNAGHTTYVAERNLEADVTLAEIQHPMLTQYFCGFEGGRYLPELH